MRPQNFKIFCLKILILGMLRTKIEQSNSFHIRLFHNIKEVRKWQKKLLH